jgi:hypothetical protein
MKRYAVIALLSPVLLAAQQPPPAPPPQAAQQQPDRRQQMQDRMAEYTTRLNLTEDQKKQFGDIMKEQMHKSREIRQKYQGQQPPDRRAMMQEMKTVQSATDERVSKILKHDQMQEWKKIQQEGRERRRAEMQQRRQQPQQPPQ